MSITHTDVAILYGIYLMKDDDEGLEELLIKTVEETFTEEQRVTMANKLDEWKADAEKAGQEAFKQEMVDTFVSISRKLLLLD